MSLDMIPIRISTNKTLGTASMKVAMNDAAPPHPRSPQANATFSDGAIGFLT